MELITDTFVLIAPDSTAESSAVPTPRGESVPVHVIQYELLTARPYELTLEELILETHLRRLGLSAAEAKKQRESIREELFRKSHACMRASALPKKYGWGVHYDAQGRIALHAMESAKYGKFAAGEVAGVKVVSAMRTKRA